MSTLSIKYFIVGLLMLAAAGLAVAVKPSEHIADQVPQFELESLIPKQFADWRIDENVVQLPVNPQVQAQLDQIYSQILSRSYVNAKGEKIMLSISYGANQGSDDFQVHRPEYCYRAQGFELKSTQDDQLAYGASELPIRRVEAFQARRNEPITYWITIGDKATLPGWQRKLTQLTYGLTGKIPDGMLIRVSSITQDAQAGYHAQDEFIKALLDAMAPADRIRLTGSL